MVRPLKKYLFAASLTKQEEKIWSVTDWVRGKSTFSQLRQMRKYTLALTHLVRDMNRDGKSMAGTPCGKSWSPLQSLYTLCNFKQ